MTCGSPGAQVICSTARFQSSHWLAAIYSSLSSSFFRPVVMGRIRLLTLSALHNTRVGTKIKLWEGECAQKSSRLTAAVEGRDMADSVALCPLVVFIISPPSRDYRV